MSLEWLKFFWFNNLIASIHFIILSPPPFSKRGVHDSCEDARTALLLYRKYKKLEASDQVSSMLGRLYETGRRYHWQVPES